MLYLYPQSRLSRFIGACPLTVLLVSSILLSLASLITSLLLPLALPLSVGLVIRSTTTAKRSIGLVERAPIRKIVLVGILWNEAMLSISKRLMQSMKSRIQWREHGEHAPQHS